MSYEDDNLVEVLNDRARENVLRIFISGLWKPYCDILFSSNPKDLQDALAIANGSISPYNSPIHVVNKKGTDQ